MVTGAVLALAVVVGTPLPIVALLGLGVVLPELGVLLLALATMPALLRRRREQPGAETEAAYHAAVAAELRSGASLRAALAHAAARTPALVPGGVARRLRSGQPLGRLVAELAAPFTSTGRLLGPAVMVAAEAGGRAAAVFDRLAWRAADDAALVHEQRTATAQARLSAWVVAGLPLAALGVAASTGRLAALMAAGRLGIFVLAAGLGLVGAGLVAVVLLMRRRA